jgi:hypothetical protein
MVPIAIPVVSAAIIVTVWAMITPFVTIDFEQPIPTQIKVIAVMTAPVPAMKIGIST